MDTISGTSIISSPEEWGGMRSVFKAKCLVLFKILNYLDAFYWMTATSLKTDAKFSHTVHQPRDAVQRTLWLCWREWENLQLMNKVLPEEFSPHGELDKIYCRSVKSGTGGGFWPLGGRRAPQQATSDILLHYHPIELLVSTNSRQSIFFSVKLLGLKKKKK